MKPRVAYVGAVPPPWTGKNIATRIVLESAGDAGPVRIFRLTPRDPRAPWIVRMHKLVAALVAMPWLVAQRLAGVRCVYLVADHGAGMVVTFLHAATARGLGCRVILHHQVYSYIRKPRELMHAVSRLLGPTAVHVVLCHAMAREFRAAYPATRQTMVVTNDITMREAPLPESPAHRSRRFRIGHLANLTREKGVDTVLAVLDGLVGRGCDVELVLAGPAADPAVPELVRDAQARHPGRVHSLGYLDTAGKFEYLRTLDAFLFPTRYPNEAYPLVVSEALGMGAPVLATDIGCLGEQLAGLPGATASAAEFVDSAVDMIERWIVTPAEHAAARSAAGARGQALRAAADGQLASLISVMHGGGPAGRHANPSEVVHDR